MQLLRILICFMPFVLFCSQLESPFTEPSNAKMHVIQKNTSFNDSGTDTANIFTTETLTIAAAVSELIDSFSVTVDKNRFWRTKTIQSPTSEYYKFYISFYDTGTQVVQITTYRSNNDKQVQDITLKVRNPLHQDDIPACNISDQITLSIKGVGDKNGVIYNWLFGTGGQLIQSPYSSITTLISSVNNVKTTGLLWVTDSLYGSPAVAFSYSFFDSTPPVIICVNDNYDDASKTVRTSDTVFNFMVRVTDRGNQSVGSVTINGAAPDFKQMNTYTSIVRNVHLHDSSNPLPMTVYAVDNNEFANDTTVSFNIVFDKNIIHTGSTILKINSITDTTLSTTRNKLNIFGSVENTENQLILLNMYLNNTHIKDTIIQGAGDWSCLLTLSDGTNQFYILAKDTSSTTLDSQAVTLFYQQNAVDTTPPVIFSKEIDGQVFNNETYYTEKSSAIIQITAFDAGSGISKMIFNDDTVPVEENSHKISYTYTDLQHTLTNVLYLKIIDLKGNICSDTVNIKKNSMPAYTMHKTIPFVVYLGTNYTDTIKYYDADNDQVTLSILSKPASMKIDTITGVISWSPQMSDTGNGLSFQLKDGFTTVLSEYFQYAIVDPANMSPAVAISDSLDIPKYLEADKDSLKFTVKTVQKTGNRPFLYSAKLFNTGKLILDKSRDSLVQWLPTEADTGIIELQVIVEDSLRFADTVYRSITILRPNRDPAQLSWSTLIEKLSDGTLYLSDSTDTAYIKFTITDADDPMTEKHVLTIRTTSQSSTMEIKSDTFSVSLTPVYNRYNDTLTILLSDNTGTTDTVIIPIVYVTPPDYFTGLYSWHTDQTIGYISGSSTVLDYWNGTGSNKLLLDNLYQTSTINVQSKALNGYNTVQFNNSTEYLSTYNRGSFFDSAMTVYFVTKFDSTTAGSEYLTLISVNDLGTYTYKTTGFGIAKDGKLAIFSRNSTTAALPNNKRSDNKITEDTWHIVSFSSTGIDNSLITADVSIDGVHDTIESAIAYSANSVMVGGCYQYSVLYPWFGEIAEIIIFNRVLSVSEQKNIELYLKKKFNL